MKTKIFLTTSDSLTVNGFLFHKIRHTKPCLNGFPFFVNIENVVRDLICILCDNEKKEKGF